MAWKDGSSMKLTQNHDKWQSVMLQCENFISYNQFSLSS